MAMFTLQRQSGVVGTEIWLVRLKYYLGLCRNSLLIPGLEFSAVLSGVLPPRPWTLRAESGVCRASEEGRQDSVVLESFGERLRNQGQNQGQTSAAQIKEQA